MHGFLTCTRTTLPLRPTFPCILSGFLGAQNASLGLQSLCPLLLLLLFSFPPCPLYPSHTSPLSFSLTPNSFPRTAFALAIPPGTLGDQIFTEPAQSCHGDFRSSIISLERPILTIHAKVGPSLSPLSYHHPLWFS